MTPRYDDADDLTTALARATRLAKKAQEQSGEGSSDAREAEAVRVNLERRLATAQLRDAKRERQATMTPSEIVDEASRR